MTRATPTTTEAAHLKQTIADLREENCILVVRMNGYKAHIERLAKKLRSMGIDEPGLREYTGKWGMEARS